MANNNFTETFQDGLALTQAELETAFKSLTLDIGNTTQMTVGSTSGHFLKSNGDGAAASFGAVPDVLGPFALRNYGLSVSASGGALTIALKTNANADPSNSDKVNLAFSSNGSTSGTYTALDVSSALSLTVTASATLGYTTTSTNRIYVYAINNAGTPRLAVSTKSDLDNGGVSTTTVMSSSSDLNSTLYATAALTVVSRLLGWVEASINSSKLWQSPTKVNVTNNVDWTTQMSINQSASIVSNVVISSTATTLVTSATVVARNRPVFLSLQPTGTSTASFSEISAEYVGTSRSTVEGFIHWLRGTTTLAVQKLSIRLNSAQFAAGNQGISIPPTAFQYIDQTPGTGSVTYSLYASVPTNDQGLRFRQQKLVLVSL